MFALLCRLQHFDLSGYPWLDQSTLAGFLACTQKNLKDATHIDVTYGGLKGEEGSVPMLSGLIFATEFGIFHAGLLPKVLSTTLQVLDLSGGNPQICEFSLWCGAKKHHAVLFSFW